MSVRDQAYLRGSVSGSGEVDVVRMSRRYVDRQLSQAGRIHCHSTQLHTHTHTHSYINALRPPHAHHDTVVVGNVGDNSVSSYRLHACEKQQLSYAPMADATPICCLCGVADWAAVNQ